MRKADQIFKYDTHKDEVIRTVKTLRVDLAHAVQETSGSPKAQSFPEYFPPCRELSIARTKMEEARMWLGKYLSFLGDSTPYIHSDNVNNSIVSPEADLVKAQPKKTEQEKEEEEEEEEEESIRIEDPAVADHLRYIVAQSENQLRNRDYKVSRTLDDDLRQLHEITMLKEFLSRIDKRVE